MSIMIDTPEGIQAFAYLQLYYKLKLEVEHPNGPTWRVSPTMQIRHILQANGISTTRTKKVVFAAYKTFLEERGILNA